MAGAAARGGPSPSPAGGSSSVGGQPAPGAPGAAQRPGGSPGSGGPGGAQGGDVAAKARDAAQQAGSQAAQGADQLKRQGGEALHEAEEQAGSFAETARARLVGLVDQQKQYGAEQIDAVARAFRQAADSLNQEQPQVADYVRRAASGVEQFSRTVREGTLDDLVGTLDTLGRRQPAALFGGTIFAGFLLSRFVKASAERRAAGSPGGAGRRTGGMRPSASMPRGPGAGMAQGSGRTQSQSQGGMGGGARPATGAGAAASTTSPRPDLGGRTGGGTAGPGQHPGTPGGGAGRPGATAGGTTPGGTTGGTTPGGTTPGGKSPAGV